MFSSGSYLSNCYAEAEAQSATSCRRLRLRERGCCGTGAQKFPPIHRSNALAYSAREEIIWRIVKGFASQSGNRSKIEVAAVNGVIGTNNSEGIDLA